MEFIYHPLTKKKEIDGQIYICQPCWIFYREYYLEDYYNNLSKWDGCCIFGRVNSVFPISKLNYLLFST